MEASEEEDMMVVMDAEADMTEVAGIIQVAGGVEKMQEWYSAMISHI